MNTKPAHCAVLDLGKTHAKLSLTSSLGVVVCSEQLATPTGKWRDRTVIDDAHLFEWVINVLNNLTQEYSIDRLIPVCHGAAVALLDTDENLVFPILDYESPIPDEVSAEYDSLTDDFFSTYTPRLPNGLNLGRQLYWLQSSQPRAFAKVTTILTYPQYWAWRFSGVLSSELSSIGCHTHLWNFQENTFSNLAETLHWAGKFPAIRCAGDALGPVLPDIARRCGLDSRCQIYCGVHDTNAALVRYLAAYRTQQRSFSLLSTGTWVIAMTPGAPLNLLDERRDCLANIDIHGNPVACARFMGGREYESILDGVGFEFPTIPSISEVISREWMALPSFVDSGGPFAALNGALDTNNAELNDDTRRALATIYTALVADVCLGLVAATGDLIVEGPFAANTEFCRLLAAFRPHQRVMASQQNLNVTAGAAVIALSLPSPEIRAQSVDAFDDSNLANYRKKWHSRVAHMSRNGQ